MSTKPLAVVPADSPLQIADSPHLERLRDHVELRVFDDPIADLAEQLERTRDAQIIINSRGNVKWMADALSQSPHLKMITTCSIGVDTIDIAAAVRQGIVVSNIPGRTAAVVAEHALAMMLAAAKRTSFQTSELKAGRWTRFENMLLAGSTLGVVGTGAIGAEVVRLGRAIGMNVIAWTFHPSPQRASELGVQFVELPELLAQSDVVSLHVKTTDQSRNLLSAEQLGRMKPGAILVNTARAALVDTDALIAALHAGRLGGAALDVFDEEPMGDHPLLKCEHVVLTPHHADQTPQGRDLLNEGAVDNVLAFLQGKPQNVVQPSE